MEDDDQDFLVGRLTPTSPWENQRNNNLYYPPRSPGSYNSDEIPSYGRSRSFSYGRSRSFSYGGSRSISLPYRSPYHSPRRKILKEDRISPLPDSLIHHILSFLPAQDAVKTGVLSKRWMYLWTSVPKLTFRCPNYTPNENGFLDFVDRTLFFYSSSKIEKFVLDFKYKSSSADLIHKWLRWVARHDAKEISLKFSLRSNLIIYNAEQPYPMPQFIFNNSSLKKLSTRFCDYAPRVQVSWRSLRVLTIEHTELSNDVFQSILLGSPMLEYLELHGCKGITSIDLSYSPMLEFLKVHKCWPLARIHSGSRSRLERLVLKEMSNPENGDEDDGILEISCPSLKSMEISGFWERKKCRLLNVSSLIHVCLNFEVDIALEEYFDMMKQLLDNIKHAKQITLGTWCIQVLSVLEFRGLPSPMSEGNCKCLTLDTDFNRWDTFGVASLLHSLPALQNLVIDLTKNRVGETECTLDHPEFCNYFGENYWKSEDRIFYCLLRHLKTVEILGLEPYNKVLENDLLAFVRFLLGNARVLKKMVLAFCSDRRDSGYLYRMAQKLLSFPRCSTRAVVLTKNR